MDNLNLIFLKKYAKLKVEIKLFTLFADRLRFLRFVKKIMNKTIQKIIITSLTLCLALGQFLILPRLVKAEEITSRNVVATPYSIYTMHLVWETDYQGDVIIHYRKSDSSNYNSERAECYLDSEDNKRKCKTSTAGFLIPGDVYYYKFQEGNNTQTDDYSYFVVPEEIDTSSVSVLTDKNNPTTATIKWQTDKKTYSKIEYSFDNNNDDVPENIGQKIVEDNTLTYSHSLTLTDLETNTKYIYNIISLNEEGAGVMGGWPYTLLTFITPAGLTNKPDLKIYSEDINAGITSNNQANVYWTTNKKANCNVMYGSSSENLENNHKLSGLGDIIQYPTSTNDGKYHYWETIENVKDGFYKIICVDDAGVTKKSAAYSFINKPDLKIDQIYFVNSSVTKHILPVKGEPFNGYLQVNLSNIGVAATNFNKGIKVSVAYKKPNGALYSVTDSYKYVSNLMAGDATMALLPINNFIFEVEFKIPIAIVNLIL